MEERSNLTQPLRYLSSPSSDLMTLEYSDSTADYNFSQQYNSSFNDSFIDDGYQFSFTFRVCIYILYNAVFVSAVLGNVLVVYLVGSFPRMRTVTNYLIGNLALGDLLMALLCVPFSYIPVLSQYWPFGQFLCYIVCSAQAVCVFVSAYTLIALAIDRYIAILYPLRPRIRRTQALFAIVIIWIVAVLTAMPIAIFTRLYEDEVRGVPLCEEAWPNNTIRVAYSFTLMILQYFFPITVLIFTYTRIAIAVWGKKAPGEAEDNRDQRQAKAKRKTVLMTLCVVVGYTLAWLPLNLFLLYNELTRLWNPESAPEIPHIEYVFFVVHWLAMAHTTYNPIIYAWINIKFRSTFYQVMRNCLPWKKDKRRFGSSGLHYSATQSRTLKSVIVTRGRSCGGRGNGSGGGVGVGGSLNLNGNCGRSLITNGSNAPGIGLGNQCEKIGSRSTGRLL